jgi:hypothetical protein
VLEYGETGTIKDIFFKIKLNNKELPFRLLAKAERVYQASWGRNWNGSIHTTVRGGNSRLSASPGEFVKPGLRHRLPLLIWSRQKSKRPFYLTSLCQAIKLPLK